tara:strand:- start:44 stop:1531 length:1488 start_codon:yes stop_codon:yes gene_type:complete
MNEELWKNKEYVKLIEKVRKKIITAYETGIVGEARKGKKIPIDTTMLNRSLNAILAQPNYAFLDKMKKYVNGNAVQLAHQIIQHEDGLLRKLQAVTGQEVHHILPQNVMKWFKDVDVKKALEALHIYRQRGGTTGVTVENTKVGGQMSHRAMDQVHLFKTAVKEKVGRLFSAHVDPWSDTLKNAPDFFSKGFIRQMPEGIKDLENQFFKNDDSIKFMVETLEDQAGGPGKLFSKAFDSNLEKNTQQYYKNLLGVDIFKMADEGSNPTLLKKYNLLLRDLFSPLKMNYNDIYKAVARGEKLPEFSDEILDIIDNFRENPDISSSRITSAIKNARDSKVVKTAKNIIGRTPAGRATRFVAGSLPVLGFSIDAAQAGIATDTARKDPSLKNIMRAGGSYLELVDQTPLFIGPATNALIHRVTEEGYDPTKGPEGLLKQAMEGAILTSSPVDKDLASFLAERQRNQIGSRDLVKYKKVKKNEEDKDEYGYAPSLTLPGV